MSKAQEVLIEIKKFFDNGDTVSGGALVFDDERASETMAVGRVMAYSRIKQCNDFWSWLFHEWDMRDHWDGPYILWRKHGYRIFGFEFEWLYKEKD